MPTLESVTGHHKQQQAVQPQVAATPSQRAGSNSCLEKRVQFQGPGCVPPQGQALEKSQYGSHVPFLRAVLRPFQGANDGTSIPAYGGQPGASGRADSGNCCQQDPAQSSKDSDWTDAKRNHSPERLTSGHRKPKGQHLASVDHCLAEKHSCPSVSTVHCEIQPRAGSLVIWRSAVMAALETPSPKLAEPCPKGSWLPALTPRKSPGSSPISVGLGSTRHLAIDRAWRQLLAVLLAGTSPLMVL